MRLGAAVIDIDVPAGTRFGGFWQERPEAATGTHDPLQCQALVAEGEGGAAAILSLDLQLISRTAVREIARRLASDPGIAPEAVLVHATHDHAAPGGDSEEAFVEGVGDRFVDAALAETIVARATEAARAAWRRRAPARLRLATGAIAGIGRFRSDAGAPARAPAALLEGVGADGRVRVVVAWYGCHASVLGPDNRLFSADHPGVVRARLRAAYPGADALYLNAPAADVSTRNTRRAQTFAEMERLGGLLADELLALRPAARVVAGEGVRAQRREIALPLTPAGEGGERAERLRHALPLPGGGVPFACQALRLGDLLVVGLEAEIGFDLGQEILAAARRDGLAALIVAPAGGSVGNLPSAVFGADAADAARRGVEAAIDAVAGGTRPG